MGLIYKAENLETGEFYIGKTNKSLDKRKQMHLEACSEPLNHFHKKLHNNELKFIWSVICYEPNGSDEILDKLEHAIIKEFRNEKCLNIMMGPINPTTGQSLFGQNISAGMKKSDLVRQKCIRNSQIHAERLKTDPVYKAKFMKAREHMGYKIEMLNQETGEIVREFSAMNHAHNFIPGITREIIKTRCNKGGGIAGGYFWRYKPNTTTITQ